MATRIDPAGLQWAGGGMNYGDSGDMNAAQTAMLPDGRVAYRTPDGGFRINAGGYLHDTYDAQGNFLGQYNDGSTWTQVRPLVAMAGMALGANALAGAGGGAAPAAGATGSTAAPAATATGTAASSYAPISLTNAAGAAEAAGVGSAGALAGGATPAGAMTGYQAALGSGALGSLGSAASSTGGGLGDYAKTAADFAKSNPGLIGAGLGALAGAAQGNVDQTQTASRGLVDYALPAGQAYAGMAQDTIGGKYLGQGLGTNPYAGANPYLGTAMDNVAKRMTDAYRTGTASQTMGQFAANGAFGGSAQQQFQESQNRAFGDALGQTLSGMQMQDYTTQQGLAENSLNRQLQQFMAERQNMMGASQGLGNLGATQTSTVQGVGPVQGALAGALGGYAMGQQWGQSAPQQVGGLGAQPLATNVQQPANATLYAGNNPNFYGANYSLTAGQWPR